MFVRYLMIGCLLFFASSGFAQMYRYADENGNIHFTDDFSRVPLSQQENVKTMTVIKNPTQGNISNSAFQQATSDDWENDLTKTSKELDQTKAKLDSIFNTLSEKKAELQTEVPPENASRDELLIYRDNVLALNVEIESYQEKRGVFEEQVKAFNARINP